MAELTRSKELILVTASYPYGTAEAFLTDEIPALSRRFEKIHILHRSQIGESCVRLPSNVTARPLRGICDRRAAGRWRAWKGSALLEELGCALRPRRRPLSRLRAFMHWTREASSDMEWLAANTQAVETPVIYSYWLDQSAVAAALLKKHRPGVRTVARAHGWDVYQFRHPGDYLPFRRFLCRELDAVCFVSHDGREYTKQLLGEASRQLKVCHLGVRASAAGPRHRLSGPLQLFSSSGVVPLKRVENIARAVALLSGERVYWRHAGDGPGLPALRELTDEALRANPAVTASFLGAVPRDLLLSLYRQGNIDLFLNASETEGIPVAMMEAMAAGIPCVGPRVGGVPEIIRDGFNGFLLGPLAGPESIAEAVNRYRRLEPDEQRRMRRAALRTWGTCYNSTRNYDLFADFLAG